MATAVADHHPDQAAVFLGGELQLIWNHEQNESPLMTITKAQTAKIAEALTAYGEQVMVDFYVTLWQSIDRIKGAPDGQCGV